MPRIGINIIPQLARENKLIDAIASDIESVGIVGERTNSLLVYVIYTSRLLEDPGAVITRGNSSGGKSTILNKVAMLFPEEVKIRAMVMSPAAWFNTDASFFKNKVFIAGERRHSQEDEARDAGMMLRQLLSEKRISRGVSVPVGKKGSGGWETKMIERDGPVAYAESTTSKSVFEEDLNRMLQLYVDDSESQNRNVIAAMASKYDPSRNGSHHNRIEEVTRRHHEFQRWLQKLGTPRIGIPYYAALAQKLPAASTESRRAAQQVFTVIEAVTLLHRHHRRTKDGVLLSTLDDYQAARELLLAPLNTSLGAGKHCARAKELNTKLPGTEGITTSQVKKVMGHTNDMATSRLLNDLVSSGFLEKVREKSGSTAAQYKWTNLMESGRVDVLPTVEELQRTN